MQFHSRHALFRIRKSAWVALLLLIVFSILRLYDSASSTVDGGAVVVTEDIEEDSLSLSFSRGLVDSNLFGVDSEFLVGRDRVFAIVQGISSNQIEVVWYAGGEEKARMVCLPLAECQASMGPDSLQAGEWSVDVVHGRTLLVSGQFRMFSK